MGNARPRILFLSSITLTGDDPTERKKWSRLSETFEITVVCFAESGFGRVDQFGCTFLTLPANWVLPLRVLAYYLVGPWFVLHERLIGNRDVWIAQSPYEAGITLVPKLLLSPFLSNKLIVEAHGDWIKSIIELKSPPFPRLITGFLRAYSSVVLWCADAYRSVSEQTRNLLESQGFADRPLVQFPGYMDLEAFLDCTLEDKDRREENTLLFAGALTDVKGVDFLLDVFQKLHRKDPELQLRLCGEGPGEQSLRERSRERGLASHLSFEGYVETQQLKKRMLEAKLLVLPSRTEGFGRVLVESLATFTPFVASETGGPTEIAQESNGGRTLGHSVTDWCDTILELTRDRETRRRMGRQGRAYVEETFSTDSYVDNYQRLIEQV